MELENTENVENTSNNEEENKVKTDKKQHFNKDASSRKKFFKKKICYFCKNNIDVLDYKDIKLLKKYVKESGKIIPKRLNGTCSKHQRLVTKAIKRARNIALLPYETKY
ncbi:30S ribosomal protein S18 [Brachyspira pilosicoli]|uniref:Small ribosomal subunit protein bS18 n=1 Tax=Brachyspira pilosicoli TaxID=52584 RepID=A0A5C8F1F7_BRAPL|nr:30S ribosomal protein S18 [Brachyspira pilosicoli]TXJ43184.1 30S ribosomal protein S18 [Brachyspira pilosicoli]